MPTPRPSQTYLGPRGFQQADYVMSGGQQIVAASLVICFVGAVALRGISMDGDILGGLADILYRLNILITIFFLAATVYRFLLIDLSLHNREQIDVPDRELREPAGGWPRYIIQVPLYKERHALPHLVDSLSKLDYPKDKLVIQLLVEADDTETKEAITAITLKPPFTVVNIPVSQPRTKPKACNVGLAVADGDYLVIYDAEDRPDPEQLKRAVIAFSRCPAEVACIQAKLNFYNADRNLITRCFTAEYSLWFDLCLPGLDHLRAPIPLGGTSNHFRLDVLKRLQGWDEYNVTEDCDLGLRLFIGGYKTRMLDSTTWEEACPRLMPWIRQRSRWVKGYAQTYLVHTRDPIALTRKLGWKNSLHFHLLIGGSVLAQLVAPLYWLLVGVWLLLHSPLQHWLLVGLTRLAPDLVERLHLATVLTPEALSTFFPGAVFAMAALCLFVGNFMMIYSCVIACMVKGFGHIAKYTPLMIGYWFLMGLAAWKGCLQLLWAPHFWEKTTHHEL